MYIFLMALKFLYFTGIRPYGIFNLNYVRESHFNEEIFLFQIEVHVPATLNTVQKNAKEYAGIVAGYGQRGYEYLTTEVFM